MGEAFLDAFDRVVGSSGWRTAASPAQLIDQWRQFVDSCREGYDWSIYEFDNELAVRDLIHRVLHAPELREFDVLDHFAAQVSRIDEEFRALTFDDRLRGGPDDHWWRRRVLRRAGDEYRDDIARRYGIDVEEE